MVAGLASSRPPAKRSTRKALSARHHRYLALLHTGLSRHEAAMQAGFAKTTAARAIQRIEAHPQFQALLAQSQQQAVATAEYNLLEAYKEANIALAFAYQHTHPMAVAKILEHKSKLFGLLIERVDVKVATLDLREALEAAKGRVLMVEGEKRGLLAVPISDLSGDVCTNEHTPASNMSGDLASSDPVETGAETEERPDSQSGLSELAHDNNELEAKVR